MNNLAIRHSFNSEGAGESGLPGDGEGKRERDLNLDPGSRLVWGVRPLGYQDLGDGKVQKGHY